MGMALRELVVGRQAGAEAAKTKRDRLMLMCAMQARVSNSAWDAAMSAARAQGRARIVGLSANIIKLLYTHRCCQQCCVAWERGGSNWWGGW